MVREEVARVQGLDVLASRERAEFLMQAATYDFLLQKYFRTPVREGGSAEHMKRCKSFCRLTSSSWRS